MGGFHLGSGFCLASSGFRLASSGFHLASGFRLASGFCLASGFFDLLALASCRYWRIMPTFFPIMLSIMLSHVTVAHVH